MLLISDYDGTIKRFESSPTLLEKIDFNKDIKSINRFIDNGNEFAISTYRKTPSIIEELNLAFNNLEKREKKEKKR